MGLDVSLAIVDEKGEEISRVEHPSKKYPDHLFKVGYWRSSYNRAGFNQVTDSVCGKTLYDVVTVTEDYHVQPIEPETWETWLIKARGFHTILRETVEEYPLRIECVPIWHKEEADQVTSAYKAMEVFRKQVEEHQLSESMYRPGTPKAESYSCKVGHFYNEPLEVVGAIPGTDALRKPCVYLVCKSSDFEWYLQAAEIVIETLEYIVERPGTNFALAWSS